VNAKVIIPAALAACITTASFAGGKTHWGYSGHEGPEHWGDLDPDFSVCASGKNQSPINLSGFTEGELAPIAFNFVKGGNEILNNGHAVQVNYKSGSSISVNGHSFELKQFHFHAPSENHINGKSFPMEEHFVLADKEGNLVVIAVLFEEGALNAELEKAWKHMPTHAGDKKQLKSETSALALLPSNKDYYRFNGSLTTPPCSEGVWWLVMKESLTASKEQIEKFAHVMGRPTNRPIQPINARMVVK